MQYTVDLTTQEVRTLFYLLQESQEQMSKGRKRLSIVVKDFMSSNVDSLLKKLAASEMQYQSGLTATMLQNT